MTHSESTTTAVLDPPRLRSANEPEASSTVGYEPEWHAQWSDNAHIPPVEWLLANWIYPNRLEDFRDKEVLEGGCGGGHLMAVVQPYARRLVGLDMSADAVARERFADQDNVEVRRGNLLTYDTSERFDIVYSVGVLHHTDDPDRGFANLARLVRPGGRMIVWVYSHEGNALLRWLIEPFRKLVCRRLSRRAVQAMSTMATACVWPVVHTLYRLPLGFLPYYEYFKDFRNLSFRRNVLNVFDKLNAPQTTPIAEQRIREWFDPAEFEDIHISSYRNVSWRGSGTRRAG